MKIVEWDDDTVPQVIDVDEHGDTIIQDTHYEFDLQLGDLVQYLTEVGTSLYKVVEIVPVVQDFDGEADYANIVALRGV